MRRLARIFFLLILFTFAFHGLIVAQGYRIEVEMKGLSSGDMLILGEYFTSRMVPMDTIRVDRSGKGVFSGEEAFAGGLYLIYLGPDKFFDFLLGDDQHLLLKADTSDIAFYRSKGQSWAMPSST